ncbi:MAG: CHASE domain-containing protein [Planctomycetes bacterium]|nr:CHASE domain-containing protein [Planctomycetota bacterium]
MSILGTLKGPEGRSSVVSLVGTGGVIAGLGAVVLVGWWLDPALGFGAVAVPWTVEIPTALGFLACGLAFLTAALGLARATTAAGSAVAFLGGVPLAEHLVGSGFGLEGLLGLTPSLVAAGAARMPPNAALCFVLSGLAIALMARVRSRSMSSEIALGLTAPVITALALVMFIAELGSVSFDEHWSRLAAMSIPTVCGFVAIGAGIVLFISQPSWGSGRRFATWLAVWVGLGVATLVLSLSRVLTARDEALVGRTLSLLEVLARDGLRGTADAAVEGMQRLGPDPSAVATDDSPHRDAGHPALTEECPWIRDVVRLGPGLEVRSRWERRPEASSGARVRELDSDRRATAERALASGRPAASPPLVLPDGGRGFAIAVPVGSPAARTLLVATVDSRAFLDQALHAVAPGHWMTFSDGSEPIGTLGAGGAPGQGAASHGFQVNLLGRPWLVRISPTDLLLWETRSPLYGLLLGAGLVVASLLGWSLFLQRAAVWRSRLLEESNGLLRDEAERHRQTEERRRRLEEQRERLLRELEDRNAALDAARKKAEEESRHKSRFLAGMSHELRTPLNAILGFTELLEMEYYGLLNPKQKDYVGHVTRSGRHLLELIDEVLDLSRIDAGRVDLRPTALSPCDVAAELEAAVRGLAEGRTVAFGLRVPAGLPKIVVDPLRLKQVLFNLLSNAVKFTPAGGRVDLSAIAIGGEVHLIVQDTGIGIPPEDVHKLFREFSRLDPSDGVRREGTGLGLVIVKRLVELLHGTVRLESEPGHGTRVTVVLPAAVEAVGPVAPYNLYEKIIVQGL